METIYQEKNPNLANALRVIGQELADLLPLILKIEVKQGLFIVTGKGLPEPAYANGAGKILSKVWKSLVRDDPATALVDWQLKSVPFTRTYSRADLSRSHNDHHKRRRSDDGLPDIYSLGERLRIVGRIVDARDGELVELTKTLNKVTFQFRTRDGIVHSNEYSADDLFRLQRAYYSRRETASESLSIA